jgi:hypothetical protein
MANAVELCKSAVLPRRGGTHLVWCQNTTGNLCGTGYSRSTRNTSHDPASSSLCMSSESTDTQRDDRWETH